MLEWFLYGWPDRPDNEDDGNHWGVAIPYRHAYRNFYEFSHRITKYHYISLEGEFRAIVPYP